MLLRALLLTFAATAAVVLGFFVFNPEESVALVSRYGYYSVALTTALWLASLFRIVPWSRVGRTLRGPGLIVVLAIAAAATLLLRQERAGFKVVMDEVVLASTASRMHEVREAALVERGYHLGDNFVILGRGIVDKRGLFYPFLVSLVHELTGFRVENSFYLNHVLFFLLLVVVWVIGWKLTESGIGATAVTAILASSPLLVQCAASGGFEVLNVLLIAITLLVAMECARTPTRDHLSALVLSGVVLAQIRYESVLFVPVVGVIAGWIWLRNDDRTIPWGVIIAPLLLIVYPLQLRILELAPNLWQLEDRPSEAGVFSFSYLLQNVGHALNYFLETDRTRPNSHLIFIAGLIGVVGFWVYVSRILRSIRTVGGETGVFLGYGLALQGLAVLLLCYFWGRFDDVVTARLVLPIELMFVLLFGFAWTRLLPQPHWRWVVAVAVSYTLVWSFPTLRLRAYAHENVASEIVDFLRRFERENDLRQTLVIDEKSDILWPLLEVSGMRVRTVANRVEDFIYHHGRGTFEQLLVVRRLRYDAQVDRLKPESELDLESWAQAERLAEFKVRPDYGVEIVRVLRIDEDALRAWAKNLAEREKSPAVPDSPTELDREYATQWLRRLP